MAASLLRAVGCTGSDDQLAEALAMYDGDVGRAANHLLDRSPDAPSRPEPPKNVSPGLAFSPDAAARLHRLLTDDNQPTLANLRYHNDLSNGCDLSNGDCAYHCLWQILVLCSPQSFEDAAPKETAQTASLMRQVLFDFIEERWDHRSLVSDITWCDMITMSHNTVVTEEERDTFGTWGESSTERLQAWRNERHDMYGSPAEMTAFVEIMHAPTRTLPCVLSLTQYATHGELSLLRLKHTHRHHTDYWQTKYGVKSRSVDSRSSGGESLGRGLHLLYRLSAVRRRRGRGRDRRGVCDRRRFRGLGDRLIVLDARALIGRLLGHRVDEEVVHDTPLVLCLGLVHSFDSKQGYGWKMSR